MCFRMTDEVIANHLILKFADEAVRCLEEGVISSPVKEIYMLILLLLNKC